MFAFSKPAEHGANVLDALVQEQITDRLGEAMELASMGLASNLDRFRELLNDMMDRSDAWQLTRLASCTQRRRAS